MERTIKYTLQEAVWNGYQGRKASAYGLTLPSLLKKYLETSKEDVILHPIAVQFSTGRAVQFSPGIYTHIIMKQQQFYLREKS